VIFAPLGEKRHFVVWITFSNRKVRFSGPEQSVTAMNHSMYSADRETHLKIVVIGLLCACFVLIVGVYAHIGQINPGVAPLVKAGGPSVISGQLPLIR
jgi:hypothetical protein